MTKQLTKYKRFIVVSLALMVVVVAPLLFATSTKALALTAPTTVGWGTIKCGSGEFVVDKHTCCPNSVKSVSGDKTSSCLFAKYVNPLIQLFSAAVGMVVVIAIITGAIQFSSSAGDPQKAANGKNRIRNALIGLLAYLLLFAFLQFVIPGGKFNA